MNRASVADPRDAVRAAWEFPATGTRWRIFHDGALPGEVVDAAVRLVAADEARWSRFRDDSELSALNRRAGHWTEVSPPTWDLLQVCVRWVERSAGVFNPLIGTALRAWGYEHSLDREPPGRDRSPRPHAVRGAIELDPARRRVRIPTGASLDLGGIGKGWIAGRVADVIASEPGHDVLVDAGGDLVAVDGTHLVAIESIADDGTGVLGFVRLTAGQAVATSGFGRRSWINRDGVAAQHLIDPRSGAPGPNVHATAVADDPVTADVTAKLLALRPEWLAGCHTPALIQRNGETVTGAHWRFAEEAPTATRPTR